MFSHLFPEDLPWIIPLRLPNPIVAWIGLDWADQKHDVCLQATGSTDVEHAVVEQKPEALQAWVAELRRRFPHGPIAIALEQSRGSLFYALMNYEFLRLYPIPPKALADYRKALYPPVASGTDRSSMPALASTDPSSRSIPHPRPERSLAGFA